MKKSGGNQKQVFSLAIALVAVLLGGVLFMGAVSGWFGDERVKLDDEYYCSDVCDNEFIDLSVEKYEELVERNATFLVFIDQDGYMTADNLRGFMKEWGKTNNVKIYRMMFSDMKETSLHDAIKFYPSVAVVSKGNVAVWLKADADEDAAAYNNYEDFVKWLEKRVLPSK